MIPVGLTKQNEVHLPQEHTDREIVASDVWLQKRLELLVLEKEHTRANDVLVKRIRDLPWEDVRQDYVFEGEGGKVTFNSLFGNSDELIVYHMMWSPKDELPCPSYSMWVDGFNGQLSHLLQRASLVVVARAPYEKMRVVKLAKGWIMPFVSSGENSFNADFAVFNTAENIANKVTPSGYNCGSCQFWPVEDWPGISVFHRTRKGQICRTYSCHARGLEYVNTGYKILDFLPFGRESFLPKHGLQEPK